MNKRIINLALFGTLTLGLMSEIPLQARRKKNNTTQKHRVSRGGKIGIGALFGFGGGATIGGVAGGGKWAAGGGIIGLGVGAAIAAIATRRQAREAQAAQNQTPVVQEEGQDIKQ